MTTTTADFLAAYEAHNKADTYCLGFNYKGSWFCFFTDKLNPDWVARERMSSKNSHKGEESYALRLRMKVRQCAEVLATCECLEVPADFLQLEKNRGRAFERWARERFSYGEHTNDNVGFWKDGDMMVNGKRVQVKLNTAQVCSEYTLTRMGWA